MRRDMGEPFDAAVFHGGVGVEALGNGVGDSRGALFGEQRDQPLLRSHRRIDLHRFAVEEVDNLSLLVRRRKRETHFAKDRRVQIR